MAYCFDIKINININNSLYEVRAGLIDFYRRKQ